MGDEELSHAIEDLGLPGGQFEPAADPGGPGGERVARAQGGEPRRIDGQIERAIPDEPGGETARRPVGDRRVETLLKGGLVKERDGA